MGEKILDAVLGSMVAGLAVTVISGLFRPLFSRIDIDMVRRGLPIPWLIQVVPRSAHILWPVFIMDLAFWILVALLVSVAVLYLGRTKPVGEPTSGLSDIR